MGRIRDGFRAAGEKLRGFPKGRQGKAFARILRFFAAMLALTIFARGAAGVTLPKVTVAALSQQSIRRADDFTGTVRAANRQDVKLPAGLTVLRVPVSVGERVEAGDELLVFDTAAIDSGLVEQRLALQGMRLELAGLQKAVTQDDAALVSAREQQALAQKAYDEAVKAQQAYDAAQAALPGALQAQSTAQGEFETYEALSRSAKENYITTPGTTEDEKTDGHPKYVALQAYLAAQEVARSKDKDLQDATNRVTDLNKAMGFDPDVDALKKALDDANAALAEAQKAYDEQTPIFNMQEQQRQLQITQKQQQIEKQQLAVDELVQLASIGGSLKAPVDGTVSAVTAAQGAVSAETDYVRISTGAEGYVAEFAVPQEQARQIRMGGTVSVKQSAAYWGYDARITGRGAPDESGNVTVRAQLNTSDLADGDAVNITVVYSDMVYWSCVPVAAVRPDSGGYYVLVLSEEASVLGEQTVARRVDVTITDQDGTYAAIEGMFDYEARVVVSASKPVNDGDKVRLDEESTQ